MNSNLKITLYIRFSFVLFISIIQFACKKEGRLDYINSNLPAPAQLNDIRYKATAGGAILTYKIPNDPNFYYAKAVYEIQPNVFREAKSSLYNDTLVLEGFGDTLTHKVKIYSVGRNEKESDPISSEVKPLKPTFRSVFESIQIVSTFGGVQVSFKNPTEGNVAIVVLEDSTNSNKWTTLQALYTSAGSGSFSIRGMDTLPKNFAVYVKDRWDNKSDTIRKNLKPIFEQAIPKPWVSVGLPTDDISQAESYKITNLWDNVFPTLQNSYASSNTSTLPHWFTIDLGVKVVMSRVMVHQTDWPTHFYKGSAVKVAEVWGSNNPALDGSWNSWDSLGTLHSFKPSGLPMGQENDQDKNYACIQGEPIEFDHLLPAYRYIRFKIDQTYASPGQVLISELDVYGQILK